MNNRALNNIKIKEIRARNNDKKSEPTVATININEGEVSLDINGHFYLIDIRYNGIVEISSKLNPKFKVTKTKNSTIRIINLFTYSSPKVLFSFAGNLSIDKCEILTFSSRRLLASINDTNKLDLIKKNETNWEDDSIILQSYDQPINYIKQTFYKNNRNPRTLGIYHNNKISKREIINEGQAKSMDKSAQGYDFKTSEISKPTIGQIIKKSSIRQPAFKQAIKKQVVQRKEIKKGKY